ncbi:hypothetical protein GGD38_003045 [Chitinophagaceae bacterium OAS944]|nr:hypothetical protein [Chitinophagaceae bacterium OAS944]
MLNSPNCFFLQGSSIVYGCLYIMVIGCIPDLKSEHVIKALFTSKPKTHEELFNSYK